MLAQILVDEKAAWTAALTAASTVCKMADHSGKTKAATTVDSKADSKAG